jgi:6-phosphogluconolactonase
MSARFAYVGSRTTRERNARGEGISVFRVDLATGSLALVDVAGGLVNPSYLLLNRQGTRLYSVHGDQQEISAFAVDSASGKLTFINRQGTGGKNPVHLALSGNGESMVVSNHITGTVAVMPVNEDGSLAPFSECVACEGMPGPHRMEQPFAKPHFNPFDPSGRFVLVPDKGLDTVFTYRLAEGKLSLVAQVPTRAGAGPRNLAFHPAFRPNKPWCYVVNELDSTVAAYRFDAATGTLSPFQVVSALADTFTGNSRAAGIAVHPAGHTLYASNRGADTLAVFSIDAATGRMAMRQSLSSGGKTPRFFTLSADGRWLFALNEESDSIVKFAVDAAHGTLTEVGLAVACASPVCLVFSTPA